VTTPVFELVVEVHTLAPPLELVAETPAPQLNVKTVSALVAVVDAATRHKTARTGKSGAMKRLVVIKKILSFQGWPKRLRAIDAPNVIL
jgi:hypothetical protein